ncbi:54S ribosomal protein L39, mitochondrial [Chytriomyces hyalinus]|nr:54S ribosomal protein L39, mitochondrial [Chytriomyces hyalinus]
MITLAARRMLSLSARHRLGVWQEIAGPSDGSAPPAGTNPNGKEGTSTTPTPTSFNKNDIKHAFESPSLELPIVDAFWHSGAHLLGWAIEEEFGDNALLDDGPALIPAGRIGGGFFYDALLSTAAESHISSILNNDPNVSTPNLSNLFDSKNVFHASNNHLLAIEKRMATLAATKSPFERLVVSRAQAMHMFKYSPLKLSLLARIPADSQLTLYKCGNFVDLCRGPHLPHTGFLASVKLLRTASATISPTLVQNIPFSDSSNSSSSPLTRFYGIAFPHAKFLKKWTADQEDALQRDHRNIGKQQALFTMHPMSPGSAFMLPHGTRIANRLMEFVRKEYRRGGYHEVVTPLVFNKDLWVTSGHWENYRDDMFLVQGANDHNSTAALNSSEPSSSCGHDHGDASEKEQQHGLKPMNCPGHCLVFANKSYSYRELPVRLAEFSPLHRNEASGALSGLTRVRKFHQDDAHIFCTPAQVQAEIASTLAFISKVFTALQFPDYSLALSTRPLEKSIGSTEQWNAAEDALRNALNETQRPYTIKEGDGAFYGPKIDVMVRDAMGRKHQTATIQLDFQLPQRFGLHYVAEDGSHQIPVVVHRAALGSVERMMGILMEHYGGKWPFWLSPRQAVVIPAVTDSAVVEYALAVSRALSVGGVGWDAATVKQRIVNEHMVGEGVYSSGQVLKGGDDTFFHVDARLHDVDATLAKRVRDAWVSRYNFVVVVGQRELENGTVSLRMNSDAEAAGTGTSEKKDQNMGEKTVAQVVELWNSLHPDSKK